MNITRVSKYVFLTFFCYLAFASCRKEEFTADSKHSIDVNTDTLWFDTVFTKANVAVPQSVNKQILIYNPHNKSIKTSIELGGGAGSHFRLNVDGLAGHSFKDIEIFPKDSIFLFVEVHPDPNNNSPDFNPIIIRDSILMSTNGNQSKTMLIGWGQDAHYIFRDSIETDTTWQNTNLPIVVYGYCYVKPDAKLTIERGMNIHFAPRSWLFVEGQLAIKGEKEKPVLMQGDRLQPDWEERSGQWGGIWLSYPSYGNTIEHALIKNGTVGIYCDSTPGITNQRNITIKKTMIRNMSFDGISGKGSTIYAENCVSINCGRFTFLGANGGNYTILNSTFYTGGRDFSRQEPTFVFLNRRRDEFRRILETYDIQYQFVNNIVYGVNTDGEIGHDLDSTRVKSASVVANNLLKTKDPSYRGNGNTIDKDPTFIDAFNYNFDLDSLSPAKNIGIPLSPAISDDFCERVRIGNPDAGAFESQF